MGKWGNLAFACGNPITHHNCPCIGAIFWSISCQLFPMERMDLPSAPSPERGHKFLACDLVVGRVMQSVGFASLNRKADHFRSVLYSSMAPLSILSVMIIGILPALKSEAFATGTTARTPNARATAVASARVVKPFTMDATVQAGVNAHGSEITLLRSTSIRSCQSLLGAENRQVPGASCELRLVEMQ